MRIEKKDHSLNDALRQYMVMVETSKGAASKTFLAYDSRLGHLRKWAADHKIITIRQFGPQQAGSFSGEIASRLAPKTANEIIKLATAFFSWCEDVFELDGIRPFRSVKRPKVSRTMKSFWTVPQIDAILSVAPSVEFKAFWALMAFAGLRYSEALNLAWENVQEGKISLVGKGNKIASIPISKKLSTILDSLKSKRKGRIFGGDFPQRNDDSIVVLKIAVAKSGIKSDGSIDHHRFRHSFASNLIRSGVNIKAVQQLMRHESIAITLNTYSHLLPTDLADAVEL